MKPKTLTLTPRTSCSRANGFALIVTISLMILLALLAVGLLSLSSVTLRSSTEAARLSEARTNARLALSMAIGRLQQEMGPDQRISANASITDDGSGSATVANARWTGVWDSWIAGPVPDNVNPDYPSPESHHQTIGEQAQDTMRPNYQRKDDYFRSWLVSLPLGQSGNLEAAQANLNPSRVPDVTQNAAILVGQGTLGPGANPADLVSARLIQIQNRAGRVAGRYGWWVGDESQKAAIMDNTYQTTQPNGLADRLFRQQAPASLGNSEIEGLEDVADETQLAFIPSRKTLELVNGATPRAAQQYHDVTTRSLGVLADVREGGLKRDLSTLLERSINPDEVYNYAGVSNANFERATSLTPVGDDFMLYSFADMADSANPLNEACVPIQDLAAYYQLYNRYRSDSRGGIQYSSSESSPSNGLLQNGIMVSNPDVGDTQSDIDDYLRQYTALYRAPVLVKIEVLLTYAVEPILPQPTDPRQDQYRLRVGVSPSMTYWNPNNVPMVMNLGNPDLASLMIRETSFPLNVTLRKSRSRNGPVTQEETRAFTRVTNNQQGELYTFFVSGNEPAVFEPGESKVFSLRFASNTGGNAVNTYTDFMLRGGRGTNRFNEPFIPQLELVPGWNPDKFIRPSTSAGAANTRANPVWMEFGDQDFISASITTGGGNSFSVDFTQKSRHGRSAAGVNWHFRNYQIRGRFDGDAVYRDNLVFSGFPLNGSAQISDLSQRTIEVPGRSAQTLVDAMGNPLDPRDDLPSPFFYYGLKAATETHESSQFTGGDGAARRFPSRPFTHSTAMTPGFIDSLNPASLYNYGWNWFFQPLDNVMDAPVEIANGNSGYYGGGYTAENGTTHVVQQYLPITPPISIANLSNAHLGGFSLAVEAPAEGYRGLGDRNSERFRRTTALGFGGLAPHTLQAIGNSYAHPNIPADQAVTTWGRQFQGNRVENEPLADHSYLANKALWDEFFFSSISPKPAAVEAFSRDMDAPAVARAFFFDDEPLPNPRIVPYDAGLTEDRLDQLLTSYDLYRDGFADQIAGHLLVEGPFNVNSTSVQAWRALFASLKAQPVSYLDARSALVVGTNLDRDSIEGVPVAGGSLPNGQAYQGSPTNPSDPEQWTGFRELTEAEINELAEAMVEQVRLRGPFLSLSDFVNRRLDDGASATQLALKGALQAALDDPDVSINSGFRRAQRQFTNRESSFVNAEFPEAMEGPVAYGSSAYVDQADILRGLPAQLTPRGDTFVIRTYGDAIDADGEVTARAWCEAVVQRLPEYVDPTEPPERRQALLTSESNQTFGRKFTLVEFRWLSPNEI